MVICWIITGQIIVFIWAVGSYLMSQMRLVTVLVRLGTAWRMIYHRITWVGLLFWGNLRRIYVVMNNRSAVLDFLVFSSFSGLLVRSLVLRMNATSNIHIANFGIALRKLLGFSLGTWHLLTKVEGGQYSSLVIENTIWMVSLDCCRIWTILALNPALRLRHWLRKTGPNLSVCSALMPWIGCMSLIFHFSLQFSTLLALNHRSFCHLRIRSPLHIVQILDPIRLTIVFVQLVRC